MQDIDKLQCDIHIADFRMQYVIYLFARKTQEYFVKLWR